MEVSEAVQTFVDMLHDAIGVERVNYKDLEDGWFTKHSWSEDHQLGFAIYLTEYLEDNFEFANLLSRRPFRKSQAQQLAKELISNYGWRIE